MHVLHKINKQSFKIYQARLFILVISLEIGLFENNITKFLTDFSDEIYCKNTTFQTWS